MHPIHGVEDDLREVGQDQLKPYMRYGFPVDFTIDSELLGVRRSAPGGASPHPAANPVLPQWFLPLVAWPGRPLLTYANLDGLRRFFNTPRWPKVRFNVLCACRDPPLRKYAGTEPRDSRKALPGFAVCIVCVPSRLPCVGRAFSHKWRVQPPHYQP